MESERLAVPSLSPCIAGLKLLTLGLVALVVAIGIGRTVGELVERLVLLEQMIGLAPAEREVLRALLAGRLLQAEMAAADGGCLVAVLNAE